MPQKINIEISNKAQDKLKQVKGILNDRGVKRVNFSNLISSLIEKISDKEISQFVLDSVPLEIKVKEYLSNPELRKRLEKVVNSK